MKQTNKSLGAFLALGLAAQSPATLVSYWTFDDASGDSATATYGSNANWANPGNNLTWDPAGVVGGAADLGGANAGSNFFEANLTGPLNSSSMTVSIWINPDGKTSSNYEGVFMTRAANPGPTDGSGATAGNGNWGIAWEAEHIDARATGATDSPEDGTFNIVADDASTTSNAEGWYHIVWTWDGVNGTQATYINGVEAVTGSANIGTLVGGVWHVGNDSCCSNRYFDGQVDDLAVWDTVLSPAQIADLASLTLSPADIDAPTDQDGDGMPDAYEDLFPGFLDKTVDDKDADPDLDGLSNIDEYSVHLTDPSKNDTDDDGILDKEEIEAGVDTFITNPLVDDTDGDGLKDGEETSNANGSVTNPTDADSDKDTFTDKEEVDGETDPLDPLDPPVPALPSEGMVALYKFDETEGTTAADSSVLEGAQDAAANQGVPLWSEDGFIGGALELDGTTSLTAADAITQGNEEEPGPGGFSISGWFKSNDSGGYKGIFTTRDASGGGNPQLVWGLNMNGEAKGDLRFANADGASQGITTDSFGTDEWIHLAMTFSTDGSEATGKAFLNGVLAETRTTNGNGIRALYKSIGTYNIGDDICCGGREFNGFIDEVSVWDVALTDEDISSIYRNGQLGNGLTGASSIITEVTDIKYLPNGDVELTWISNPSPGTEYTIWLTTDLSLPIENWSDADDGVATDGTTTTYTIPAAALGGVEKVFFAVQKN